MVIASTKKLAILYFSFFVWLSLFPYMIWGHKIVLPIVLATGIFFFFVSSMEKKIPTKNIYLASIVSSLAFVFYVLNYASVEWSIVMGISIMMLLLNSENDIKKTFNFFKILFALSLFPGMFVWLLYIIGFDVSLLSLGLMEDSDVLNQIKVQSDMHYVIFPGSIVLDYMLNWPVYRLQGMYDEPGVVGTISSLILVSEKLDIRKRSNLIILIGGLMTLSLAFYLIVGLYYLLTIKTNYKKVLIIVLAFPFFFMLIPAKYQNALHDRTVGRVSIDRDFSMLNYNRDAVDADLWDSWKRSDSKGIYFGSHVETKGSSTWKNIFIRSGVLGFLIVLLSYFVIFYQNYRRINYSLLIFLLMFALSFLQRPYIVSPVYFLIFVYAMYGLQSNERYAIHFSSQKKLR